VRSIETLGNMHWTVRRILADANLHSHCCVDSDLTAVAALKSSGMKIVQNFVKMCELVRNLFGGWGGGGRTHTRTHSSTLQNNLIVRNFRSDPRLILLCGELEMAACYYPEI
jgi:hypothetical protein